MTMKAVTLTTAIRRLVSDDAVHAADLPWVTQESLFAARIVQDSAARMHHQAWERRLGR
jgi:hypothetical protein